MAPVFVSADCSMNGITEGSQGVTASVSQSQCQYSGAGPGYAYHEAWYNNDTTVTDSHTGTQVGLYQTQQNGQQNDSYGNYYAYDSNANQVSITSPSGYAGGYENEGWGTWNAQCGDGLSSGAGTTVVPLNYFGGGASYFLTQYPGGYCQTKVDPFATLP
ncbi:MAG: hypothetical protein ACYDDF_05435 [Thermoplasmatota archaeon]